MAKKILGWGYKLSGETIGEALTHYGPDNFHKTRAEAEADAKKARESGDLPERAKPRMFKVVVELV